jgi:hypothetical protein
MIAMQYSIGLPADYEMDFIRRRIVEKGPLLDGFPGLGFKAYLYADRNDAVLPSRDNLYAPFYAWRDTAGMNAFLCGDGFATLSAAFGRPAVQVWSVWQDDAVANLRSAVCASRDLTMLPPDVDLKDAQIQAAARVREDIAEGALAAVDAYDPQTWTSVSFRLWDRLRPELARPDRQLYRVGHVSLPQAA